MKENLNWTFWTAFIIALIGALSWTPQIYLWIQKNAIYGKVLSEYGNSALVPNKKELQNVYVQKISLFSKNKDFFPKDIKVFIKYPSKKDELSCTLWTWRDLIFTFNEDGKSIQKKLNIDLNDYLIQKVVFPKNETIVGYVSFSVDYQKDEAYDYLRYEFIDFKGNIRKLKISNKEIESNKLIHEDNIWID